MILWQNVHLFNPTLILGTDHVSISSASGAYEKHAEERVSSFFRPNDSALSAVMTNRDYGKTPR